jgi:hypothetical protein
MTQTNREAQLGQELYELMCASSGATPEAIRSAPTLMSFKYIRAEVARIADLDTHEQAVAVVARRFIEEATHAPTEEISQRDDKDADRGAAARCLLGLYPGTDSMILSERRIQAAGFIGKKVRSTTKKTLRNTGRLESYETILMARLAGHIWDREVDFISDPPLENPAAPPLAALRDLIFTVDRLTFTLDSVLCRWKNERAFWPKESRNALKWFSRFVYLVKLPQPEEVDLAGAGFPNSIMDTVALIFRLSPFSMAVHQQYADRVRLATPELTSTPRIEGAREMWSSWIESCHCDLPSTDPACLPHQLFNELDEYGALLAVCWADFRDPYHSPTSENMGRSVAEILEFYAIDPDIDKKVKYVYSDL